ncbi:hypothetical protein BFJ69_g17021 [Fusarium oxysporum]|uniref:Extracellular membrane protein CFEM domain-containing protein n=1 Tax=Fusarium oxysporum TaxID=5507 RepID=A0A420M9F9_FUSOX|nr:hypothetical protein BFJ69_g17021 [Fusarium oxysporum]
MYRPRLTLLAFFLGLVFQIQVSGTEDLSFCYGERSICEVYGVLLDQCYSKGSGDPFIECLCQNGYVSVDQACYWCQLAYDLNPVSVLDHKAQCSSAGVSIAPIPSSILDQASSYNATYTGTIRAGAATATRSGLAATTMNTEMASGGSLGPKFADSNTWFGGTTNVVTLKGGDEILPTAAGTSFHSTTVGANAYKSGTSSRFREEVNAKAIFGVLVFVLFVVPRI